MRVWILINGTLYSFNFRDDAVNFLKSLNISETLRKTMLVKIEQATADHLFLDDGNKTIYEIKSFESETLDQWLGKVTDKQLEIITRDYTLGSEELHDIFDDELDYRNQRWLER